MGGAMGRASPRHATLNQTLARWHVKEVYIALQKACAMRDSGMLEDMISRSTFVDVFNHIALAAAPDAKAQKRKMDPFLPLPFWVYDMFKVRPKSRDGEVGEGAAGAHVAGHDRTSWRLLFVLLLMWCTGDLQERTRLCFRLYDSDANDLIDRDELRHFMTDSIRVLVRMGLMETPAPGVIKELAKDVFEAADTDKSGKIGPEEFYEWARVHNSTKSLMDRFQRVTKMIAVNERMRKRQSSRRTWDNKTEVEHPFEWGHTPKSMIVVSEHGGSAVRPETKAALKHQHSVREVLMTARKELTPVKAKLRAAENSIAQDRAVATARIAMSLDAIDDNENDDSSDDEDVLTPLKLDLKQLLQGPTTLQLKRTPSSFNVSLRKRNLQGKEGQWGQHLNNVSGKGTHYSSSWGTGGTNEKKQATLKLAALAAHAERTRDSAPLPQASGHQHHHHHHHHRHHNKSPATLTVAPGSDSGIPRLSSPLKQRGPVFMAPSTRPGPNSPSPGPLGDAPQLQPQPSKRRLVSAKVQRGLRPVAVKPAMPEYSSDQRRRARAQARRAAAADSDSDDDYTSFRALAHNAQGTAASGRPQAKAPPPVPPYPGSGSASGYTTGTQSTTTRTTRTTAATTCLPSRGDDNGGGYGISSGTSATASRHGANGGTTDATMVEQQRDELLAELRKLQRTSATRGASRRRRPRSHNNHGDGRGGDGSDGGGFQVSQRFRRSRRSVALPYTWCAPQVMIPAEQAAEDSGGGARRQGGGAKHLAAPAPVKLQRTRGLQQDALPCNTSKRARATSRMATIGAVPAATLPPWRAPAVATAALNLGTGFVPSQRNFSLPPDTSSVGVYKSVVVGLGDEESRKIPQPVPHSYTVAGKSAAEEAAAQAAAASQLKPKIVPPQPGLPEPEKGGMDDLLAASYLFKDRAEQQEALDTAFADRVATAQHNRALVGRAASPGLSGGSLGFLQSMESLLLGPSGSLATSADYNPSIMEAHSLLQQHRALDMLAGSPRRQLVKQAHEDAHRHLQQSAPRAEPTEAHMMHMSLSRSLQTSDWDATTDLAPPVQAPVQVVVGGGGMYGGTTYYAGRDTAVLDPASMPRVPGELLARTLSWPRHVVASAHQHELQQLRQLQQQQLLQHHHHHHDGGAEAVQGAEFVESLPSLPSLGDATAVAGRASVAGDGDGDRWSTNIDGTDASTVGSNRATVGKPRGSVVTAAVTTASVVAGRVGEDGDAFVLEGRTTTRPPHKDTTGVAQQGHRRTSTVASVLSTASGSGGGRWLGPPAGLGVTTSLPGVNTDSWVSGELEAGRSSLWNAHASTPRSELVREYRLASAQRLAAYRARKRTQAPAVGARRAGGKAPRVRVPRRAVVQPQLQL